MNKRIDYSNLGGYPIDQDTLAFMQSSYRDAFGAMAGLCGNKTILTGVQVVGSNVTAGWISYNGELIPFQGGGLSADVFIDETATSVTFQDNTVRNVEFTKVARCGTPGTFPFSDLKRLNSLQEMWLPGDLKQVICDAAYITANFDGSGLGINERLGWKICNEMGGRVAVGYSTITIDPSDNVWDAIYNTIGATAGEKKHQLTIGEMPAHGHTLSTSNTDRTNNAVADPVRGSVIGSINTSGGAGAGKSIGLTGGDQAHENRQPFIVTLFIQKL